MRVLRMLMLILESLWVFASISHRIFASLASWIVSPRYKNIKHDIILITGGGKGIGKRIAICFAKQRPAHIVLWGRHENTLKNTADEIKDLGVDSSYMVCDVSKKENIFACAKELEEKVGQVTILVNNAGVVFGKPILESSDDAIVKTMQVNVIAHFWTLKAFLPSMIERNSGHIVSISSVLGLIGLSGAGDYVSSKFASTGLAESLLDELRLLKKTGVKITSIHPYHIDNSMFEGLETRLSRWLIPPLKEDYVAEKTVHAVLTNRTRVLLPRLMYFLVWFKWVSPVAVNLAFLKLTGSDKAMEGFKGRLRAD